MEIVFPCEHCGKNLVAEEAGRGETVECPACGGRVVIPLSPPPPPKVPAPKRMVVHIPSAKTKEKEEEAKEASRHAAETAAAPARSSLTIEITVGWVCVVVGVVLELLLPRALLVYLPFFIGSFLMGLVLFANGRVIHAAILLLCTCIPPPLLMHQDVWKHGSAREARRRSGSSQVQELVFDAKGRAKLVSSEPEPDLRREPSYRKTTVRPSSSRAPAARRSARTTTPPPRRSEDPFADLAAAPKPQAVPAEDQYRDLLEGTAEVPALVPEDVLAQTRVGRGSDFLWQDPSSPVTLSPDEPAPVADMPFVLCAEAGEERPYKCSGRMGNENALHVDDAWNVDAHSGTTCVRVVYQDSIDWVTAAWQHPPYNWGDLPGGYDFSNARKLTFWARGDRGRERVEFLVGMEQSANAVCRDSLRLSSGVVKLRTKWKKYSIPLEKEDRSRLITPFLFRIEGQDEPVTFYLDDVQFE